MNGQYQLITFDVYSALFDLQGSLVPVAAEALGDAAEPVAFVQAWRRTQMQYVLISNSLQRGRLPFAEITSLALDYALNRNRVVLSTGYREKLTEAWLRLEPYSEAEAVLREVKSRGYPIAMLSNGDKAMLQALAERLEPDFDHIYSTEDAGFYKPRPEIYHLPLDALNLEPEAVLHVAGSATDVTGTKSAGLGCAWSNRDGDRVLDPRFDADHTFSDLNGILEIV